MDLYYIVLVTSLCRTRPVHTAKTPVRHQDTIHTRNMDTLVTFRDECVLSPSRPSFPSQDFQYDDRRGSYDPSSYSKRGFGHTNGDVDRNPNKYPWNPTEHVANMSSDNVTPWVTEDSYSGELITCHPVASSFAQGTFKSDWAGFNLDWENKDIRAFVSTFPTFSKTTSFYVW
jgi:hypothetical protein